MPEKTKQKSTRNRFGTFGGVFTPSILTILGVIMFMRANFVIGQAGVLGALSILIIAKCLTLATSSSLAAISTNMRVRGGGSYFIISRVLGVEFGGAIGLVLFLAQSVSIAFYCIGFGEVISGILQVQAGYFPQIIAAGAVMFLFIFE